MLQDASAFLFPGYLPLLLAAAALVGPSGRNRWHSAVPLSQAPAGNGKCHLFEGARRSSPSPSSSPPSSSSRVAIALTIAGPTRVRFGSTVVFSARSALRPWLLFGVVAIVAPRAPAAGAVRLRRPAAPLLRPASAARRPESARGAVPSAREAGPSSFYALLALVSLWLSIGPPLGLWPLVYWLPGMSFIRVPSRFTMLAVLGLAIVAGAGLRSAVGPVRRAPAARRSP